MAKQYCPFREKCPFSKSCKDHRWLCFWAIWLALLLGLGFVVVMFWTRGRFGP